MFNNRPLNQIYYITMYVHIWMMNNIKTPTRKGQKARGGCQLIVKFFLVVMEMLDLTRIKTQANSMQIILLLEV